MRSRWAALALITVVSVTAACGSDSDPAGPGGSSAPTGSSSFPVTVDIDDTVVEIPTRPERIVSLSSTATEMLYAVGAGEQVVAVDEHSDYPEGVPTTDLSAFAPNIEAISTYDPDLVVLSHEPGGLVSGLGELGIPALWHTSAATLDDTYAQIERLGVATGHADEASALVEQMRTDLAGIVDELPERPEPITYYHELTEDHYSVTSGTFVGELYGLLGMQSIADEETGDESAYPQLSAEFIIDADPDVILLADAECCGVDAAAVAERPGWNELTAVREQRVIELDEDLASRWGPRVVQLLRTLAQELDAYAR